MDRKVLTDGRWFDAKKAEKFEGETRWDGHNHFSVHTGSQWSGQNLYRTAGKKWIVERWFNWQGALTTYEEIDDAAAAAWLVRNGDEPHEDFAEEFAALEVQ
jgi:hypothetical protein